MQIKDVKGSEARSHHKVLGREVLSVFEDICLVVYDKHTGDEKGWKQGTHLGHSLKFALSLGLFPSHSCLRCYSHQSVWLTTQLSNGDSNIALSIYLSLITVSKLLLLSLLVYNTFLVYFNAFS